MSAHAPAFDHEAYLRAIGWDGPPASPHGVACEVCDEDAPVTLVAEVDAGEQARVALPVVGCPRCGHVYQNPRFDAAFYETWYDRHYRRQVFGESQPERDYVADQARRGEYLARSLGQQLPATGALLDVGCSAGASMMAFARRGWRVLGTDPDAACTRYGRDTLGLDVRTEAAERMALPDGHFDFVMIIGSLEHVHDVGRVLSLCRAATRPGGRLLLEGRALGFGIQRGRFSHNHRRYLHARSMELLMLRHGWQPEWTTTDPLSGPTRPGAVHVLGCAAEPMPLPSLHARIAGGCRETIPALRARLASVLGAIA
jgi:SAM-dependent methyltransferase